MLSLYPGFICKVILQKCYGKDRDSAFFYRMSGYAMVSFIISLIKRREDPANFKSLSAAASFSFTAATELNGVSAAVSPALVACAF